MADVPQWFSNPIKTNDLFRGDSYVCTNCGRQSTGGIYSSVCPQCNGIQSNPPRNALLKYLCNTCARPPICKCDYPVALRIPTPPPSRPKSPNPCCCSCTCVHGNRLLANPVVLRTGTVVVAPAIGLAFGELTSHELDDDFTPAIEGVDVVVSFLGPNWSWPTGNPLEKAMIKIMETMKKENVERFMTMGTASITDSLDKNSYKMRALVCIASTFASTAYNDIIAVGNLFKSGKYDDLEWTVGRVGILKSTAKPTGRIHTGYIGDEEGSVFCQRADWARFVLTEISDKQWIRKMPLISSV